MKRVLFFVATLFIAISASAHAVFIETSLQGAKGNQHRVKVVYGEPDEHEEISKWWWYKDGLKVNLTLTKPDGSKQILSTIANKDHLLATFIPDQDGVYHVALQLDTERKPESKSQYQINASASIQVGASKLGNTAGNIANTLNVYPTQDIMNNRKPVSLVFYERGKPVANTFFQVLAPSGWGRWVETDENGVATFVPEWTGKYFVEGTKKEKVQGYPFEEYSRSITYSFEVK